jgi:hypothetical protein
MIIEKLLKIVIFASTLWIPISIYMLSNDTSNKLISDNVRNGYLRCGSYKGYVYMLKNKLYSTLDNDEIIIIDNCVLTLYN